MTKRSEHDADAAFLVCFDTLNEDVPLGPDEAKDILREAGIDPDAELARLMSFIGDFEKKQKTERFARAERERQHALQRISARRVSRSRPELLAHLELLKSRLPNGAELQAHFRGFESAPEEDLESLVAEFEELIEHGQKK